MERIYGYTRILTTGAPAPLATVTVYDAGTLNLSTIFSDNITTPTPKSNPFTSDASGFFYFYASDSKRYDIRFSGTGIVIPYTWGDVSAGNASNLLLNTKSYGAVGDGSTDDTAAFQATITAARTIKTGIEIPPGIYKISAELTVSGIDIFGVASSDQNSLVDGAIWPIFKPAAGFSRLFKVGPPTSADRDAGYTDHTSMENITIDLSSADNGFTAVGADYGLAFRTFRRMHIRGVSGSVIAKNHTGFNLHSTSIQTDVNAYNMFEFVQVFHVAHAFNLSSNFAAYCNANTFINCGVWNASKYFSLCGLNNKFITCGAYSFYDGWTPGISSAYVIEARSGTDLQATYDNHFDNFYIENVTGINRPFFYVTPNTSFTNVRGMLQFALPISEGGASDYIQYIDESGNFQGPTVTHGGVIIVDDTVRAGKLNIPNVQQNRIPNGNFNAWPNGLSFSTPTTGTAIMQGFTALKGGSTSYSISRIAAPDIFTLTHDQSARLQIANNAGGVTGFQVDLAAYYTTLGIKSMGASTSDGQNAAGGRICIGMMVYCSAAQGTLDGAYISCHTGAVFTEFTQVVKYDGTKSYLSLQQQAGGWTPIFLNVLLSGTITQLICKFGLNNDGAHAGTGDFPIQSVFMYPGWYDWYTIWNVMQPRGLDAWAGSNLFAVSDLTAAWTPGLIADKSSATLSTTVADAHLGDQVIVGYDKGLAAGLIISGTVVDNSGTVRVTIANNSGGGVTPTAGNATISVLRRS